MHIILSQTISIAGGGIVHGWSHANGRQLRACNDNVLDYFEVEIFR